jgi:hypothetical protein
MRCASVLGNRREVMSDMPDKIWAESIDAEGWQGGAWEPNKLYDDDVEYTRTASIIDEASHPDDLAVNRFSKEMKLKLCQARKKGRGGWDDPSLCSTGYIAELFIGHLQKNNDGNFLDLANLLMMLHERGADPVELTECLLMKYHLITTTNGKEE